MNRRNFVKGGLLASACLCLEEKPAQAREEARSPVIDAHCHAGKGFNYGKNDPSLPAYTT